MPSDAISFAVAMVGAVSGLIALACLVCELALMAWRWIVAQWDAMLTGAAKEIDV